ncbi:type II toxin-antitoxin system death-on-curing family toxin [Aliarcobacter butzleri]|uniref:type II toxin-antitoxin system death-on-curing family toxin n=1 Tax=Aliarcobacter butzleri TaxID=28197 RepID=UPI00125FBEA7|nr:type II toxin-antitoxin system death-on-curing family toxin [Aliarcobacter butzleri]MCG3704337.1 type II toxin-antitoxin system death-on-curing family toxin [Aliarcobacter butzleri]
MEILYFDIEFAIKIHDKIIEMSGGREGANDIGLASSVLDFIQDDLYYPTFEEKLTHLVYGINKNHAFNDGNKRSSIALGAYFMRINGYEYGEKRFIYEMENIAVSVADNIISKDLLQKIITSLLYEIDYSEELKLEIFEALSANEVD